MRLGVHKAETPARASAGDSRPALMMAGKERMTLNAQRSCGGSHLGESRSDHRGDGCADGLRVQHGTRVDVCRAERRGRFPGVQNRENYQGGAVTASGLAPRCGIVTPRSQAGGCDRRTRAGDGGCTEARPTAEDKSVGMSCIMTGKKIRRMVGSRKGSICVVTVQYEGGEVMQYIFERSEAA